MAWCEANRVDYLFGLARNARLVDEIAAQMEAARDESEANGKPARRFRDFTWSTLDSWSRTRRVIGKSEWTGGEANPRFVVTSLKPAEIEAPPVRHATELSLPGNPGCRSALPRCAGVPARSSMAPVPGARQPPERPDLPPSAT